MPDTTDVNLILKLGGLFSEYSYSRGGARTWAGVCKVGLNPTEKGALLIAYPSQFDRSQCQISVSLSELKEAIAELEKFNTNQ